MIIYTIVCNKGFWGFGVLGFWGHYRKHPPQCVNFMSGKHKFSQLLIQIFHCTLSAAAVLVTIAPFKVGESTSIW